MPAATGQNAIFITGAASGIGRATARLFAERGWWVGGFDIDDKGLKALQDEAPVAITSRLDVTDPAEFSRCMALFTESAGDRLDLIFNNAGVILDSPLEETPWEAIERLLRINLFGMLIGAQAALPFLKRTEGSLCMSTCSASAIFGSANLVGYSASKGAVRAATEALSIELHSHGVRAADVMPGIVETGMLTPETKAVLPPDGPWRLIQPHEVAEIVWRAYHEDRIHWYVPEDLKALHVQAIEHPEQTRDYFLALGRG